MKLSITFLILLQSLFIAAEALPLSFNQRQNILKKQDLEQPQRPLAAPVNTWDSTSSASSDSSSGSKSSLSTKNPLLSAFNSLAKSARQFKCHHKPAQPILTDLSIYITDLFKTYRDELFDRKGAPDRIPFEVCMGGYEEGDVSPAILIKEMTKRQLEKMERICKSQMLRVFPDFSIVKSGKELALVQGKLQRRSTI